MEHHANRLPKKVVQTCYFCTSQQAAVSSKGGSGLGVESLALKCIRVIAENFKGSV